MRSRFDRVSKGLAQATSRRQALKIVGAGIAGGSLLGAVGSASAAPQECVTCFCGTGRPCNVKSSVCTTTRGFPDTISACRNACRKNGQNVCSTGMVYHCARGCPA